jgi:hypothetical protein
MTKKIPSIVVAILTAGATAYAAIYPLLTNPTDNAIAIVALVWAFIATASHVLSDYLPQWWLNLVTDLDGFMANVKKSKADVAKAVTKTTMIIMLVLVSCVAMVGCSSACSALLAYAKGEPIARPALELFCNCLPVDKQVCADAGKGLDLSGVSAQNIYNAYCAADAGESDASVDAGNVKLAKVSKLSSREDVRAYLIAQGAKVVSD